jgi:peptidoglycan/xylan/chitin deacetylase (PgdA/CDA1 family)
MESVATWAKPGVDRVLRRPSAARIAAGLGGLRSRGLALLWHRVGPVGPTADEAVPTVATGEFAAQLEVLSELGDVVPLRELERRHRGPRPRFALTFDDDDAGHVDHTLPLLRERGLPATFFLSGRWPDQGPYWWGVLETRILAEGLAAVASSYGLPGHVDAPRIAQHLTGGRYAAELAAAAGDHGPPPMRLEQARQLVAAGMEVGFHTRHHPSLPTLDDIALHAALRAGRAQLADGLGVPIIRFAYPHGHVDGRVAVATAAAGYRSAWTTRKRAVTAAEDPMRYGRWDLGHLGIDAFRAALLRGLVRPAA